MTDRVAPLDIESARRSFAEAQPFPHIVLDHFLADGFARRLSAAYPDFEEACTWGKSYAAAHENRKVQITDPGRFPTPVQELNDILASREFLQMIGEITGIDSLLADADLKGGGMHVTAPGGWLDVHVDFNLVRETGWHRRLNILIFLNEAWEKPWGGELELWDAEVRSCVHSLMPSFNRCVVFETSGDSYHGVRKIAAFARERRSFAAYYYTLEPPHGWDGKRHSTLFRFRPGERWRRPGAALRSWARGWSARRPKRD